MTYVKLFESILASTIWGETPETRIVWITMLTMADRDGHVQASIPGLAHLARVTLAQCEKALAILSSPDPHSRTKEHEGRRIEACEGGWKILNYEVYRDRESLEQRRERDRLRQARKRERDASRDVTEVTESHKKSPTQIQIQMQKQIQKQIQMDGRMDGTASPCQRESTNGYSTRGGVE